MADAVSMRWQDVLFAHWPVEPASVQSHLPAGLDPDTYDDAAWIGLVPFRMVNLRSRGSPFARTFPELNFRTYVRHGSDPGVYFFGLDAPDRLAVQLGRWQGLPYYRAEVRLGDRGDEFEFACRRTHDGAPPARFVVSYRQAGGLERAEPGTLARFLVERTDYYLERGGRLLVGSVDRDPFEVAPASATVHSNGMFESVGLEPAGDPVFWYAAPDGLAVTDDGPRPVSRDRTARN